jgi:exodeoxyribonuclease-3
MTLLTGLVLRLEIYAKVGPTALRARISSTSDTIHSDEFIIARHSIVAAVKLATWNVNSLKVRLPHLLDWLCTVRPDVVCLQETKLEDPNFPLADIEKAGYQATYAGQKTYNGVAILSRAAATEIQVNIPGNDDPQKRVLAATVAGIRVVCAYIPNGESVTSEKYRYKLDWLDKLIAWLATELKTYPKLALLGDYNIAPEERDVYDPKAWAGQVLFSEPERAAFRRMLELGLTDSFRMFEQPEKSYSWWDYRMNMFKRKLGLRIDHILLSAPLAQVCRSCIIDREMRARERPSDHAPVLAEIEIAE